MEVQVTTENMLYATLPVMSFGAIVHLNVTHY